MPAAQNDSSSRPCKAIRFPFPLALSQEIYEIINNILVLLDSPRTHLARPAHRPGASGPRVHLRAYEAA